MRKRAGVQSTTLAILVFLASRGASGADTDAKRRAAELFEQGVRQFSSAQYEAAAQAFLTADELLPNSRALINGLTAARRAGLHLVVARAAQRVLARTDMDAGGAALAREALVEAARNLTLVEVGCTTSPCTIDVDGAPLSPGPEYVLPGTHDFAATAAGGASATEHLRCEAGASYRVLLEPKTQEKAPSPAPAVTVEAPRAAPVESPLPGQRKPLPPSVFVAGATATVALVALTTWSGIDTLSAESAVEADPDKSFSHVQDLALRTDLLLTGALVVGAATAVVGIWFVDWSGRQRVTAVVAPGFAGFAAGGRF